MKTRDQSEDRVQSNAIVFGYTAYPGAPTNYGVKDRNGNVLLSGSPDAERAVRAATRFDVAAQREAEQRAVRSVSALPVTPEEDEAFLAVSRRFLVPN